MRYTATGLYLQCAVHCATQQLALQGALDQLGAAQGVDKVQALAELNMEPAGPENRGSIAETPNSFFFMCCQCRWLA
jgi:hypothetical protein